MKPFAILLGVTSCLVSLIEASITTNTPFKSVTWNGGEEVKVVWDDDGKSPKLREIGEVSIDLMVGGDKTQIVADNIGKVPATEKEIEYEVPKDVGPPGDFYFIRYTGDNDFVAFSGTFSVADVNGKIEDFDPENPNGPATGTPSLTPSNDPALTTTSTTTQTIPPSNSPTSGASPQGNSTDNQPKEVPVPISSNSGSGLLPNLFVVSTTITALALTYLHYET